MESVAHKLIASHLVEVFDILTNSICDRKQKRVP